mmetsp:Transcript_24100/g.72047  ORF Transcript_24100/g.72047 Transcript_24100/m.72047 type:complete len:281 (-) Transcript_24100:378-1220(-)
MTARRGGIGGSARSRRGETQSSMPRQRALRTNRRAASSISVNTSVNLSFRISRPSPTKSASPPSAAAPRGAMKKKHPSRNASRGCSIQARSRQRQARAKRAKARPRCSCCSASSCLPCRRSASASASTAPWAISRTHFLSCSSSASSSSSPSRQAAARAAASGVHRAGQRRSQPPVGAVPLQRRIRSQCLSTRLDSVAAALCCLISLMAAATLQMPCSVLGSFSSATRTFQRIRRRIRAFASRTMCRLCNSVTRELSAAGGRSNIRRSTELAASRRRTSP